MADDAKVKALFERYDTNKNGVLDREEFFIVFKQLLSEMGENFPDIAEDHGQPARGFMGSAEHLQLVFYGGPVFIGQGAFHGHGQLMGIDEGHDAGELLVHQAFDLAEHGADTHFRRSDRQELGQDLVHQIGTVGALFGGQPVHPFHQLVQKHQAVQTFMHGTKPPLTIFDVNSIPRP